MSGWHPPCRVLVVACESATGPGTVQARLDTEFQLALEQVARLEGADLRIEFEAVPADSRCPPFAYCFWAGDALVELEVWEADAPEWRRRDVALHTNPGVGPAEAVYGIYDVQLVELEPGYSPGAKVPYVVTLRVVELSVMR
jgi:hypothetical protein